MAELVLKTNCHSQLRNGINNALNISFPLWGIVAPLFFVLSFPFIISLLQTSDMAKVVQSIVVICMVLSAGISCLLLKRAIERDYMLIDRQGVKLPRFVGTQINFRQRIPWSSIVGISAQVDASKLNKSRLRIQCQKRKMINLNVAHIPIDFLEQFILAARNWAPSVCDPSLDGLQTQIRNEAHGHAKLTYTDMWEEELGRRFSPTSYIPLESGRMLRNNSLRIVSHLASGGLSALYLCQLDGNRLVVLKEAVVPENSPENLKEKAKELFQRESELLMKLNNPGVVKVLDTFAEAGRNYLMLEYIEGTDLRQYVKQNGAQKEAEALDWALQVATTLKYLHEREEPIIHRDLTPDNLVLRNDGQVIIVDFGAANEFIGQGTGTFVGKHCFIPPEQLRGKATTQSDIYSFGCTLYFLLTGMDPEALSTSNPKDLVPSLSEELCEFVETCTQLEPADRFKNVAQMLPTLRRLKAQSTVV